MWKTLEQSKENFAGAHEDTVFARVRLLLSLSEGGPFSPSLASGTLGHPWPAAA